MDLIARDVWWLRGTKGCNVYLARTATGNFVVFDTGFSTNFQAIVRGVEVATGGVRPTHIFLTHGHFDHSNAAAALRDFYGCAVVAGEGDCVITESGEARLRPALLPDGANRSFVQRLMARAFRRLRNVRPVPVDLVLRGDTEVCGVTAIPTPGHTAGSYCYLLPDRGIAFVGDLVISHPDRLTRPLRAANADDAQYLRSLAEFAARSPDTGCPGHGEVVVTGFRERLTTLSGFGRAPRAKVGVFGRVRRLSRFVGYLFQTR